MKPEISSPDRIYPWETHIEPWWSFSQSSHSDLPTVQPWASIYWEHYPVSFEGLHLPTSVRKTLVPKMAHAFIHCSLNHSDWFQNGYVTQGSLLRLISENFVGVKGGKFSFYCWTWSSKGMILPWRCHHMRNICLRLKPGQRKADTESWFIIQVSWI